MTLRLPSYGDTLVVTGSRAPEALRTAPVAVTVLRSAELETTAATNYSDLLRSVPGANVIELSTRDVQIVTRGATGRNARSTLALLDGRSIYQDYFGMVLWDLLPVGLDEVKQVEVARGPGSAIWGANALTGAINIITKSPREMLGTRATVGIGERDTREAAISHAAQSGRVAYRLSGSYYTQARWDRPPTTPDGTPLPPYESLGTTQNKADVRVDFDQSDRAKWRFDAGFASSNGLIIVAPGPYQREPDAADVRQRGIHARQRLVHGDDVDPLGAVCRTADDRRRQHQQPVAAARCQRQPGGRRPAPPGVWRARYKHSHFDLSFVPDVHHRDEGGAFITDDLHLTDTVRVAAGARLDWFDTFGLFASPRLGIRYEPSPGQTIRATYNRAYSAPSTVESYARLHFVDRHSTRRDHVSGADHHDRQSGPPPADDRCVRDWIQRRRRRPFHRQCVRLPPAVERRDQSHDRRILWLRRSAARWPLPADRARRARIAETLPVGERGEPHGVGVRGAASTCQLEQGSQGRQTIRSSRIRTSPASTAARRLPSTSRLTTA